MRKLWVAFLLLTACQTIEQKNLSLVQDRVAKLKSLSQWSPISCRAEVTLTQPALARYQEMFPKEKISEPWNFTWRARETTCELTSSERGGAVDAQKAFQESALCLLLQVHWVNSPFDELTNDGIVSADPMVQLRTGADSDLGVFLDREIVRVETRTKSRGVLSAAYAQVDGQWLPSRVEQRRGPSLLVLDEFEYEKPSSPGARPQLKSFWISVGSEQAFRHSQTTLRDCKSE